MRYTWCTIVFSVLFTLVCCKKFESRCKLTPELIKAGIPRGLYLGKWVCLVEKVSKRDTAAFEIRNNKKFYGLYQIPGRWCREGKKGGECNVACECEYRSKEALLDDDIRDDTSCALQIFNQEGFKYWTQWVNRCKNDNHITTEIYKCPDLISYRTSPDRAHHSESLRVKRKLSRKGKERSRILRRYNLPWLR